MPNTGGARARIRAQLTEEIKDAARLELAASGSSGLSLRAVARRLEMVPSALYRYFDGRDTLLTALIVDAYGSLARAVSEADAAAGRPPLRRWLAVGHAARDWAWAHPHEWGLLYGAPVPGYEAPQTTIEPGTEVVRILGGILTSRHDHGRELRRAAGGRAGGTGVAPGPDLPVTVPIGRELHRWLDLVRDPPLGELPDAVLALATMAFVQLLGGISLELFGQYGRDATPARAIFDHNLRVSAALLGLTAGPTTPGAVPASPGRRPVD